jgi:biotin transport system substrate-specific component
VLSPSFGYLLGFIAAPAVSGFIARGRTLTARSAGLAAAAGLLSVYVLGVPYLACYLAFVADKPAALAVVLQTGFAVFLPGDALKCAVLAMVTPRLGPVMRKVSD